MDMAVSPREFLDVTRLWRIRPKQPGSVYRGEKIGCVRHKHSYRAPSELAWLRQYLVEANTGKPPNQAVGVWRDGPRTGLTVGWRSGSGIFG